VIALDLFAGVGWAVACQRLGITDRGVENAPVVVEARGIAGFETLYRDVWDGLLGIYGVGRYDILIASPPCQTFSAAGSGSGRRALNEVLAAISGGLYRDVVALHALTEVMDPRTALVLAPLAHVYRDRPAYVVLEQVPQVLPVWEAYATVMRDLGYSVVTRVLNAEQYGVPQTRRRAILIARRDGVPAEMPTPTHSRYYTRSPKQLDIGVEKWVSMADALGWERDEDAMQQRHRGAGMLERHGERPGRPVSQPALTITGNASGTTPGGFAVLRSNYGTSGDPEDRGERSLDQPAATITSKAGRNKWVFAGAGATAEATGRQRPRELAEPAHTVTGSRTATFRTEDDSDRLRLTPVQAATLQTFPDDFYWPGNKGQKFLLIGNAVPPLLGQAVLEAAIAR
jgi:DNA (cytosine-5)-methyltransferase 1